MHNYCCNFCQLLHISLLCDVANGLYAILEDFLRYSFNGILAGDHFIEFLENFVFS